VAGDDAKSSRDSTTRRHFASQKSHFKGGVVEGPGVEESPLGGNRRHFAQDSCHFKGVIVEVPGAGESPGSRRHYVQEEKLRGTGTQVLRHDTPPAGRKHLQQKSHIDGAGVSVSTTPERSSTHQLRPHLRSPQNHLQGIAVHVVTGEEESQVKQMVREVDSVEILLHRGSSAEEELLVTSPYIRPGSTPISRQSSMPTFTPPTRTPPHGKRPDQAGDLVFPGLTSSRSAPSLACTDNGKARNLHASELWKDQAAARPAETEAVSVISPARCEKIDVVTPIRLSLSEDATGSPASVTGRSAKCFSPRTQAGIRAALAEAVGLSRCSVAGKPTQDAASSESSRVSKLKLHKPGSQITRSAWLAA